MIYMVELVMILYTADRAMIFCMENQATI
jgi:hypothetical protein